MGSRRRVHSVVITESFLETRGLQATRNEGKVLYRHEFESLLGLKAKNENSPEREDLSSHTKGRGIPYVEEVLNVWVLW
jgi:hypothetical protein